MKDVVVHAPPAEWFAGKNATRAEIEKAIEPPSPQEIIQAQDVEIRRLSSELYKLRVTAGTIANAAVALTHMLLEDHEGTEVRVTRALRNRLDGAQIKVRTDVDSDIFVSYCDGSEPVWDGRADG